MYIGLRLWKSGGDTIGEPVSVVTERGLISDGTGRSIKRTKIGTRATQIKVVSLGQSHFQSGTVRRRGFGGHRGVTRSSRVRSRSVFERSFQDVLGRSQLRDWRRDRLNKRPSGTRSV